MICPTGRTENFCAEGWTVESALMVLRKLDFWRNGSPRLWYNLLFTSCGIVVSARTQMSGCPLPERLMLYSYLRPIEKAVLPLNRHGRVCARVPQISAANVLPEEFRLPA